MFKDAKYGKLGVGAIMVCDGWEVVPCEEVWAPHCEEGLVGRLFGMLVPNKVEPSKVDPKTIALTGVWDDWDDVSAKLGIPSNIGGRFNKCLEQRRFCGSPMMLD